MSMLTNMLINVTKMLAKNAVQKPEILNPGTSAETSSIITALITSRKSPNVTSVSGIVRIMTTGRITALTKPNSNADINSDFLLLNEMPWKMKLVSHSASAVTPQCARNSLKMFTMAQPLFNPGRRDIIQFN